MTDYLEEHLSNAEALLKRIQQLEQSASGLSLKSNFGENVENIGGYTEKEQDFDEKSEIKSKSTGEVYDPEKEVDRNRYSVDELKTSSKIQEKEEKHDVNYKIRAVDNRQNMERSGMTAREEEKASRTNAERAENRSPLSTQLEELDRAVSDLTALIPGTLGAAQSGWSAGGRAGGYPVSLPGPQGLPAGPTITGAPDEAWSGPGAAARAGFAYGGMQSWAEQADRMFRRDSRRYDGGFYLY